MVDLMGRERPWLVYGFACAIMAYGLLAVFDAGIEENQPITTYILATVAVMAGAMVLHVAWPPDLLERWRVRQSGRRRIRFGTGA